MVAGPRQLQNCRTAGLKDESLVHRGVQEGAKHVQDAFREVLHTRTQLTGPPRYLYSVTNLWGSR